MLRWWKTKGNRVGAQVANDGIVCFVFYFECKAKRNVKRIRDTLICKAKLNGGRRTHPDSHSQQKAHGCVYGEYSRIGSKDAIDSFDSRDELQNY